MKYMDNDYIVKTFMEEVTTVEELEMVLKARQDKIYGFVVGHWTTEKEEEQDSNLSQIVYRDLIKLEDLTNEYVDSINFGIYFEEEGNEFIGVLYNHYADQLPSSAEYTMFIDESRMQIGGWHFGTEA